MTRIIITPILMLTILFVISCKKDNDRNPIPAFSAPGYWMGSISAGVGIGIINREDGTSRLYILLNNTDSTAAPAKFDGTYSVSAGVYKAQYHSGDADSFNNINMESSGSNSYSMSGVLVQEGATHGTPSSSSYTFTVSRQQ